MGELTELWFSFMRDPIATNSEYVPDDGSKSRWQQYVAKHLAADPMQVLVADEGGKLAGYLLYDVRSDDPITRRYGYAMITDLYVLPEFRRRGMASMLMGACLRHLEESGVTHVRLQVMVHNEAAKFLYMKIGFAVHMLTMELLIR